MITKEELIKDISSFLDDSPFFDAEIKEWKNKITTMSEKDLAQLFELLKEKLRIITDTNQIFINIAEDVTDEQEKELSAIPKNPNIFALKIDYLSGLMRSNLTAWLNGKSDFVKQLDLYFKDYNSEKDVVADFELLIASLTNNQEKIFGADQPNLSQWLRLYDQFNDSNDRKSLDRLNFINQNENAKKISQKNKIVLLDLLKIYDYLLNPDNFEFTINKENTVKAHKVTGLPKTPQEKEIEEFKTLANNYPPGSLEHMAIEDEIKKLEAGGRERKNGE